MLNRLVGSNPTLSAFCSSRGSTVSYQGRARWTPNGPARSARGRRLLPPTGPPTERISWFPVPDEEDLDPPVKELVEKQREKLGAPNNVVRTHAWRPELMLR